MTATAYPPNMTDLRGDSSGMWSGYGPAHLSSRIGSSLDATFQTRPRAGAPGMDSYAYSRYSNDEPNQFDRSIPANLGSSQGYPGAKRSFSQSESSSYSDMVQDLRDDGSRLTVNQDHKLLSFRRSQEKNTVVDQHGRVQQLELSAQLHGMFFLSEMPTSSADGASLQPELTCYRRNLFQISGSFIMPRGPVSVINDANETLAVNNMEVTISAIESVDGNAVRLIVIPWKTPPPNSPEVGGGPDQEPPALPLIPFQDNSETEGEYAVYPIGWRRLQFRIATANNGRRKELQQHFILHLKVVGTLSDNSKVVLTESTTSPIVVRGRSPRNFQARKEIPLLGSSAGSRGQALVETGVGVIAGPLSAKRDKTRSMDLQMPRSSFTFSPPKPAAGQLGAMRSNSYPTWNSQIPTTTAGGYPATTLAGATAFGDEMPMATSMAPSMPMSLVGSDNVPRYLDNSRPSKSPRHGSQQSIHGSVTPTDTSSDYRYGYRASVSSNADPQSNYSTDGTAGRDLYPQPNNWSTSAAETASSLAYAGADARSYSFSHGGPSVAVKNEPTLPGPAFGSGSRSSFESMNNYSWSTN